MISQQLERYVWELEKCSGCGACVACCSKGVLQFQEEHEHPVHREINRSLGLTNRRIDTCSRCEAYCEKVCPRLNKVDGGDIISVVSARTSLTSERSKFGDLLSDVINQMLVIALEGDFVDGAIIHDVDRWPWATFSRIVTTPEEIYASAGHQLIWSPTLVSLDKAIHERGLRRIAVVGAPCVMSAARLIMASKDRALKSYKDSIRFLIGRFCEGMVNRAIVQRMMEGEMGISPRSMARMDRSKDDRSLTITKYDGNVKEISLANVQKFLRKGCARCTDYLAENSDISIGYAGSRHGYCTIVTWNQEGESLLRMSEVTGHVEITRNVDTPMMMDVKRSKEKRHRSQEYDDVLLAMLQALDDQSSAKDAIRRYRNLTKEGSQ
ncbi:MAG TPA: Coenzyme F420 hydrogenase/dehydrogenase, beta subunit C-terminal domain [Methanomassiliicoccales archaeon]|nr:Coenzyme F420 hydrogenase/dehydrogenase, beta subunit C-terminal domain [Methanomassiliicoccales archaeon]